MSRLAASVKTLSVVLAFLLACGVLTSAAVAVGVQAIAVYVGSMVGAWLFAALAVPLTFAVITPAELVASIRSRRAQGRYHDGERLPRRRRAFVRRRDGTPFDESGGAWRVVTAAPLAITQERPSGAG